jgi:succinoglycan biosynthesis transport protein ExoP
VRGSIVQSGEMASRQVAQVQKALDEQRARIIALKQQRDELAVLNRDVESARAAYDSALKQVTKTRMESRLEGTNIAVLNAATAPLLPDSPHVLLNLIIGTFIGALLALGLAIVLELQQRVLRSSEDLSSLDLVVLCELPSRPDVKHRVRGGRSHSPAVRLQPNVA